MPVPKPTLTFVVGITGHRSRRLAQAESALSAKVVAVLIQIGDTCETVRKRDQRLYSGDTVALRLLTGFADGADLMAASAMPAGWQSCCLLPMKSSDYLDRLTKSDPPPPDPGGVAALFQTSLGKAAGTTILPKDDDEEDASAFQRAAHVMLRQIDLLIAIWDGEDDGFEGGTSEVVRQALDWRLPVAWIAANGKREPWIISHWEDRHRGRPMADALSGPLRIAVERTLGSRKAAGASSDDIDGAKRLDAFLNEEIQPRSPWIAYDLLSKLRQPSRWRFPITIDGLDQVHKGWASFLTSLPDQSGLAQRFEKILLPRFAAADALATWYGHAYRSAYVLAYLLSVAAACVAAFGFLWHGDTADEILGHKAWLVSFELLIVTFVIWIVRHGGRKGRWHERWLDYRALAEALRHLRVLGLLGHLELPSRMTTAARPGSGWIVWYLRATARELGLPSADLGASYQRQILEAVEAAEIDLQIGYHLRNGAALRELDHLLHAIGLFCFFVTGGLLVLFLSFYFASSTGIAGWPSAVTQAALKAWLIKYMPLFASITAIGPALGAAVSGIRFTGDFNGFSERSTATAIELKTLKQRYALARDRLVFDETVAVLDETAQVMAADLQGWRALYGRKRLTLPG